MVTIYITLVDGYVSDWGTDSGDIKLTLDKNHPFFTSDFFSWKYIDGELVFDEDKRQQRENERIEYDNQPSEIERLEAALLELAIITMGGGK